MSKNKETIERFSHLYLDRSQPLTDSIKFRKRLGYFVRTELSHHLERIVPFLKLEMGLDIYRLGSTYDIEDFFIRIQTYEVLDAITLIYVRLDQEYEWLKFVRRCLDEENLGYYVDNKCVVHLKVDEEFQRNRTSTLKCLENPKYSGIREAFEHAFNEMDSTPPHTKDAVRSIFECLEILVKQMIDTDLLNAKTVRGPLKAKIQKVYQGDPTALGSVGHLVEGFADWVTGIHPYRHGQNDEEPVVPPLEFAVYALSSGTAFLRWLVSIDTALNDS